MFFRKKKPAPQERNVKEHGYPEDPTGYVWGGRQISPQYFGAHYCIVGATGSGKTNSIEMLMQSALGTGPRPAARAFIYDPKLELYPVLCGMGFRDCTHIMHPFDARRRAWALAKDLTDPGIAFELAAILCPSDNQHQDSFWTETGQQLLGGVIQVLSARAPGVWTLNDLVEATATPQRLKAVLGLLPETADLIEQFALEPKPFQSMFATMRSKLNQVGLAAASWSRSKEPPFSLRDWFDGPPSILLVGADESRDAATGPIVRALFRMMGEFVTSHPNANEQNPTWVFLDEVRLAGRLDGLKPMLLKGRSKGVHVVLGFQDILGMQDVYGPNVANELVGQCSNLAFLRITNPQTAEWASKFIGRKEFEDVTHTKGTTKGTETTESESIATKAKEKDVVPPQMFMLFDMPDEHEGTGMRGAFILPGDRWVRTVYSRDISKWKPRTDNSVPGYQPLDSPDEMRRSVWTASDFARLNLEELQSSLANPEPSEPVDIVDDEEPDFPLESPLE